MSRTRSLTLATVFTLFGVLALVNDVGTQTRVTQSEPPDHQTHHQATEPTPNPQAPSSAKQTERAAGMMAEEVAAVERLETLLAKMNASTGASKVDAMADLLTALVQQQKSMHDRMMASPGMMPMHEMMDKKGGGK